MDWENAYYMFGVFFFVTWFVFMTVAVVALIVMMKRMQELQAELSTRMQAIQDEVSAKLNAPSSKILLALLPLIPTLLTTGRKLIHKK